MTELNSNNKYKNSKIFIPIALFLLLFIAADIHLQFTPFGQLLPKKIWRQSLIIDSNPSLARLKILKGSKEILSGRTPLKVKELPYGNYQIQLYKDSWGEISRKLMVFKSNKNSKRFHIANSTRNNNIYSIPFEIRLTINSLPEEAEIFLDNKSIGQTPHTELLTIGSYDIKLKKPGFHNLGNNTTVNLAARLDHQDGLDSNYWKITEKIKKKNQPKHLLLTGFFRKNYKISSNPSGAKVYLNNSSKSIGLTPLTLSLLTGNHRLKIIKKGYNNWINYINISQNSPNSILANLTEKKTSKALVIEASPPTSSCH